MSVRDYKTIKKNRGLVGRLSAHRRRHGRGSKICQETKLLSGKATHLDVQYSKHLLGLWTLKEGITLLLWLSNLLT